MFGRSRHRTRARAARCVRGRSARHGGTLGRRDATFRARIEGHVDRRVEYVCERITDAQATVGTVEPPGAARPQGICERRATADTGRTEVWLACDRVVEWDGVVAGRRNAFTASARSAGMDGLIADVHRSVEQLGRVPGGAGSLLRE